MSYIVRIRGVEVVCESLDDVDQIIDRYGGTANETAARSVNHGAPVANVGTASDVALLRSMVNAGTGGLLSETIGQMLGKKGKGIPPALFRWAMRVGISQTDTGDALEATRPQGARGWRLREGALTVAKEILERR